MKQKIKTSADELSPITGRKTVIVDTDDATGLTSKLCLETGYTTNSYFVNGSKTVMDLKNKIPKVAYENKITDKFGQVWIPMMQMTDKAAIFPIGDSMEQFSWQVCPIKKLSEEEKINYPNPEKPGEYLDSYVAEDEAEIFDFGNFEEAFDRFAEWSELATE